MSQASKSAFIEGQGAKDLFILRELVTKDFKLKYRRSVLGVVWSVLNPLLMMIVMSFVFSSFLRYASIDHYPLYLILGNITWSVFSDSTGAGVVSIIDAAPLLKKVKVNKLVFPSERVLFSLVNFAFSLVAVVLVMVWEQVWPTPALLLLPICLVLLMFFCIGMSLLLSALAVFFRDVIHLWGVLMLAWMYATPIFWPVDFIADVPYAAVRLIMLANPMYNYITFMRMIFINGQVPELITFAMCAFWAVAALALGFFVFHRLERKFILYI
ncbi:ABC transporter permease [uncultured Parolsenella sp.]|uniref:ABC transporter permease n=1 Tax=uncultured Parolsenella sp. TaxID=2083008 RepID=UPI0027DC8137|nr:ABC transporter permease [uncultured Parolsenella sp.]